MVLYYAHNTILRVSSLRSQTEEAKFVARLAKAEAVNTKSKMEKELLIIKNKKL